MREILVCLSEKKRKILTCTLRDFYLELCIPLIYQIFKMESKVSREAVKVLWRHFSTFEPLQIHYILLIMSHLKMKAIYYYFTNPFWSLCSKMQRADTQCL